MDLCGDFYFCSVFLKKEQSGAWWWGVVHAMWLRKTVEDRAWCLKWGSDPGDDKFCKHNYFKQYNLVMIRYFTAV